MNDHDALELCKRFGGSMSRAGILDTLDGGWLIIGTVPKEPIDGLAKWQFNPDQPRDENGRWTSGGNSSDNILDVSAKPKADKPIDFQNFFATYVPMLKPTADRLNIDENYLLALVAAEDTWGEDEHNKPLHNLFGVTHAGANNLSYDSYQDAIDYWERKYGPGIKGSKSMDDFIANLRSMHYNVDCTDYDTFLKGVYASVVRHRKDFSQ